MPKRSNVGATFQMRMDELNVLIRADMGIIARERKQNWDDEDDIYAYMSQISLTPKEKDRLKGLIDEDIFEYLVYAYSDGLDAVGEMLDGTAERNEKAAHGSIYKKTAGKTWEDRLSEHIDAGTFAEIPRLAETESHRVLNESMEYGANELGAVYKEWHTMLDDRVRDTHDYLERKAVPMDEAFTTFDGDSAMHPGGFELPENNIGCRCYLRYYMRREEDETE